MVKLIEEIKRDFQSVLPRGYFPIIIHCAKTTIYTNFLIEDLNLTEKEKKEILIAAYLHDIGKMKIPEEILNKNSKLTEPEFLLIKKHPEIGYNFVIFFDSVEKVKNYDVSWEKIGKYILYHHERFDGKGYPYGLKKDEIPYFAQIISLADVYDALTEDRPYRPPFPVEKAFEIIFSEKEKQFNPEVVELFVSKYHKFIEFKKQVEKYDDFKCYKEVNPNIK